LVYQSSVIDHTETTVDSPERYRARADHFLKLASEAIDPVAASMLRLAADECLGLAEKAGRGSIQQQQQIQPKEPQGDDK
jgi:hypothetical protein